MSNELMSIKKIYERFPHIQNKIETNDHQIVLTNQDMVFYQMVQFFKAPKQIPFNLNMIYDHLRDQELLFAIEVIILFFQQDTTLVWAVDQTYYDQHLLRDQFVGQYKFSKMVEESIEGMKFKPSMIHTYWRRKTDRIPNADLIIDGTPYWKRSTVACFIEKEKERRENKRRENLGK